VRATSAPNTYIFTELLQTPQVQALGSSDEFASYLTLLEVFSHGTYSSYTFTPGLPELNDAQRLKLRQLSLLTLAKKGSDSDNAGSPRLDYASLQKALDLPSRQALEELVISAIYAGLLKAQLNPKASLVQINSVAPLRDVAPTAISSLLSSLQAWAGRCDATLQSLSCQMNQLRADADRRAAKAAARAEETRKLVETEQKGGQAPSSIPPVTTSHSDSIGAAAAAAATTVASTGLPSFRHPTASINNPSCPSSGNSGGGNTYNTPSNEMSSMLTVGGSSSGFVTQPGVPSASGTGAAGGATDFEVRSAVKRGNGQIHDGDTDEDVMSTDSDDDEASGKGRASRRKLGD
jgi:COP9 signalosome complex subunit 7